MKRREAIEVLSTMLAGTMFGSGCGAKRFPARRPNVVLFFCDDAGYADFGINGCLDIPTPRIDLLARSGVRFASGYVSSPVCSPSRAGLLTGRYQSRFGHDCNRDAINPGLPDGEHTLAESLAAAGYTTGLVGKWHLGGKGRGHPLDSGFSEFFGTLIFGGLHASKKEGRGIAFERGRERTVLDVSRSAAYVREATDFIHRHREQPFFLYLPWAIPHAPLQMLPEFEEKVAHISDPERRKYATLMASLDHGVGKVMDSLQAAGLSDNTMVFFLNDNGGPIHGEDAVRSNAPFRGGKGMLTEGGIRVIFLWSWPAVLPAGRVYEDPVISLDLFPTIGARCRAEPPGDRTIDGVDLLPFVQGENPGSPHPFLAWRTCEKPHGMSIRAGEWKLTSGPGELALYNLGIDPGESRNLAGSHPEQVKELLSRLDGWSREVNAEAELRAPRRTRRGGPEPP